MARKSLEACKSTAIVAVLRVTRSEVRGQLSKLATFHQLVGIKKKTSEFLLNLVEAAIERLSL